MARRHFTDEFKRSAIALVVEQKRSRHQVALELGLGHSTLDRWLQEYKECHSAAEIVEQMDLKKQVAELQKQVQRLTMERDILKKAAAYFAKDQP